MTGLGMNRWGGSLKGNLRLDHGMFVVGVIPFLIP